MTPKNKKVSTKFRANLYAFTCIACILWFAQSYADFRKAGTLTSAPSTSCSCASASWPTRGVRGDHPVGPPLREGEEGDAG